MIIEKTFAGLSRMTLDNFNYPQSDANLYFDNFPYQACSRDIYLNTQNYFDVVRENDTLTIKLLNQVRVSNIDDNIE